METHDMPVFAQIMAGLGELYGKAVSEALTELYWAALKRYEITSIRQAVNIHINNPDAGQFMPKPADIVRYLEGSTETQGMKAWSKVLTAIKRVGPYESIVFDDHLIHIVVNDMGGWVELCKISEQEEPFRGREFEKRYSAYVLQKPPTYPKQLSGIHAHQNTLLGYVTKQPVLFGDEQKSLKVYQGGHEPTALYSTRRLALTEIALLENNPEIKTHGESHDT